MGQAQRSGSSHRSNARDNISIIYGDVGRNRDGGERSARSGAGSRNGTGGRTGAGSRNRAGGGTGAGSRNGTRARKGSASQNRPREGARRRRSNRELQELELWELSKESESSRLMRLANREPDRPAKRRRGARRRQVFLYRCFTMLVIAVCLVLIFQTAGAVYQMMQDKNVDNSEDKGIVEVMSKKMGEGKIEPPAITEDFLEVNEYSRPGTKVKKVKSIFVHYTANPRTSARQNRSYFANLAETHERPASAHFIIGYEGEVVQCIPRDEQAHAVISRNEDSLSIECCYLDEDGKFTQETYDTLIHMLAWLTQEYDLTTDDILRHYDCGGKLCPLYYVEHEDLWEQLLADVENYEPEEAQ